MGRRPTENTAAQRAYVEAFDRWLRAPSREAREQVEGKMDALAALVFIEAGRPRPPPRRQNNKIRDKRYDLPLAQLCNPCQEEQMSSHTFPTSPTRSGEQRKFVNPTPGYVGANVFGPDGKPTAVAVEPGGEVWLTPEEERMTAEAPRHPADNPFVKQWDEPVAWDPVTGEATQTVPRNGTLALADEPARPIASDRFIPPREERVRTDIADESTDQPLPEPEKDDQASESGDEQETVTGAPPLPEQPPVEGQPSPDEVVGTPEAVAANDETLAKRETTAEQPTVKPERSAADKGGAIPV